MNSKLTQSIVRSKLKEHGVTIRNSGVPGEYLVRLKGSPVGHGYFTDDLSDALDTGIAMAKQAVSLVLV